MLTNPDTKSLKLLLLLAAISFVPTLFFYYVGEEGIYAITSMEMWHQGTWLQEIMYGRDNQRPPLMNWLVFPAAGLLGWHNVLVAIRSVSVLATVGSAVWLGVLAFKLTRDKAFALFAVLTYFSLADLALYRGWLSYTDPTFAFFVFGAIASLWIASAERRRRWLLVTVVMLTGALMTKALTGYLFYGIAAFVLVRDPARRRFLLSVQTMAIHGLAIVAFLAWFAITPHGESHGASMVEEITRKLAVPSLADYFAHLTRFVFEVAVGWCPPLLLALYFWWKRRGPSEETHSSAVKVAAWIALLNFLPYWFSPQSGIRYLLPIYPVVALACAGLVWQAGGRAGQVALRWYTALLALKFILVLAVFPYYQQHYRGKNYQETAIEVMKMTQGHPLYVDDVRSIGLSVTAYIDSMRYPLAPLVFPPPDWNEGFLLTAGATPDLGIQVKSYALGGDQIRLYCRGSACGAFKAQ